MTQRMPYASPRSARSIAWRRRIRLKTAGDAVRLAQRHADDQVLIIGQYLDQLKHLAEPARRAAADRAHQQRATRASSTISFGAARLKRLVVSKVANFAIDLPDANVAIQVSGTFGSRQEEAQRLGRLLRPKADGRPAHFYTIVTRDTRDQEFSANRQLFLTEQGYRYTIEDAEAAAACVQTRAEMSPHQATAA